MIKTVPPLVACVRLLAVVVAWAPIGAWAEDRAASGASNGASLTEIDRTTCYFPLASTVDTGVRNTGAEFLGRGPHQYESLWRTLDADTRIAWSNYQKVWRLHHADPKNESVRRFLGLSLRDALPVRRQAPRAAPDWLRWQPGTYRQLESPHFQLLTKAAEPDSRRILEDLENTYWVWTQMFFPLWKSGPRVASLLDGLQDQDDVADFLKRSRARLPSTKRLRVVLFANAQQYQAALADSVPGIEMSSGFYGDGRRTMFLFVGEKDDAATRRHELTHQLFREATPSGLGRGMPGQNADFWLVEGIAGYMESLRFEQDRAVVGGWDSDRLQFARYRVFATNDFMPTNELHSESMTQVQSRADLPRWYAHSIMQTHWLMDHSVKGEDYRGWVFAKLAQLYRVQSLQRSSRKDLPLTVSSLKNFLSINDSELHANPTHGNLRRLCLLGCSLTREAIASIPRQKDLEWLDLSRIPVAANDVERLVERPATLRQLSLEATRVDNSILPSLARASELEELDLSWTLVDDRLAPALSRMRKLNVLWLTGSKVGDGILGTAAALPKLQSIDLQRTKVSDQALMRLKRQRVDLNVNPLQLQPAVGP